MFKRKPPDPRTHPCKKWRKIADGEDTFIEECVDCGRQRARIYHR